MHDASEHESEQPSYKVDEEALRQHLETMAREQSMLAGFFGGLAGAIIGAIGWALITVATNTEFGLLAIAVGLLAGYGVRLGGKGLDKKFGVLGALLAVLGCAAGKLLALAILIANEQQASAVNVILAMATNPGRVADVLVATFHPMDLLFYGIAIYEGYHFSFRKISQEELTQFVQPGDRFVQPGDRGEPNNRSTS